MRKLTLPLGGALFFGILGLSIIYVGLLLLTWAWNCTAVLWGGPSITVLHALAGSVLLGFIGSAFNGLIKVSK